MRAWFQLAVLTVGGCFLLSSPAGAVAPDTVITKGPSGLINKKSASFKFKSINSGSTFECKLDGKDWANCDSPKAYKRLKQGQHTFQVRARKDRAVDKTPADRTFTVDTIAPDTVVYGPADPFSPYANGYTEDQTPESSFMAPGPIEPVTFECRITSESSTPAFAPCETPFTPATPLSRDVFYTIEARAIDEAGNADPTPGSWDFSVETPITEDQATVELAAALVFPDSATVDARASCGSSVSIDCPGGVALPPDDGQLSTSSSRSIVSQVGSDRYDVTVTHGSNAVKPVALTMGGSECELTFNSANGTSPTWTISESLTFLTGQHIHGAPGGHVISASNVNLSGIQSTDYALGGSFACQFANFTAVQFADVYQQILGIESLCVKLGPGYIARCSDSNLVN